MIHEYNKLPLLLSYIYQILLEKHSTFIEKVYWVWLRNVWLSPFHWLHSEIVQMEWLLGFVFYSQCVAWNSQHSQCFTVMCKVLIWYSVCFLKNTTISSSAVRRISASASQILFSMLLLYILNTFYSKWIWIYQLFNHYLQKCSSWFLILIHMEICAIKTFSEVYPWRQTDSKMWTWIR